MKIQVVVTRTDAGATTKLMSNRGESSKNYASWDDALKEAEHLKLINTVEATAAKALPPGFPLHTTTEMDAENLANDGFTPGKRHHLNSNDRRSSRPRAASSPPISCILPLGRTRRMHHVRFVLLL